MCEKKGETLYHIFSECKKINEYKRRHDSVARLMHGIYMGNKLYRAGAFPWGCSGNGQVKGL